MGGVKRSDEGKFNRDKDLAALLKAKSKNKKLM